MSELKWFTSFSAAESEKGSDFTKLTLRGILIDASQNKNAWMVEKEDFVQVAKDFVGKQIRVDHSEKVSDVKGVVKTTEIDEPHSEAKSEWDPPTEYPHIHYVGEISSNDPNVIVPIKLGYVSSVSPAVDAKTLLCSKCRKPMMDKFVKNCDCEDSVILLKDIQPRELSIVASPAYKGTIMVPFGFAAAVDNSLLTKEQILDVVEDELSKRNYVH